MNILIVTDEMTPGGVARHVTDLANGLVERRIRTVVAATDGPVRRNLEMGVEFLDLSLLNPITLGKRATGILNAFTKLHSFIKLQRIDIIHSQKRLSDIIARAAARTTGICHVSTCHNTFDNLRLLSWFGDETIAPSEAIHRMLIDEFGKDPSRVHAIPLGMHPLATRTPGEVAQYKKMIGAKGKRILASIGRLEKSKDRLTLLRAIDILNKNALLGDVIFLIVGDGPERAMLQEKVREFGLENAVIMLDSTTNVTDALNAAEFCTISSNREGGTLYVNLEAASLHKPHIATNVGGIPEFIKENETGILVPPQAPERLADAIAYLLRNPDQVKRMGTNAYVRYTELHSYDRFIDQIIGVYRKVLERTPTADAAVPT